MTLQDLKESKSEIVEVITSTYGSEQLQPIMAEMVRCINFKFATEADGPLHYVTIIAGLMDVQGLPFKGYLGHDGMFYDTQMELHRANRRIFRDL